ncbi:MAG: hypothetical protein SV375_03105 [Thermodesulfobacteriota bacterium]|nr:hypothetical protein [Thermodesulfobacteriota bacterium]
MEKGYFAVWMIFISILFGSAATLFAGEVTLMFPKMEEKKVTSKDGESFNLYSAKQYKGKTLYSEIGLKDFVSELEQTGYRVDYIELWIEARTESNGFTKLFISPTSTGGCKIFLQPNFNVMRQKIQPISK